MIELMSLLAQGTPATGSPAPAPGLSQMLFPLLLMGAVFYFLLIRPQSAEKKRRESMLSALKKNDRVVTAGGILGTVLNVKDDEVTLKVDESSNTKITFTRSAIQRVLGTEAAPAGATVEPAKK
ncbi:preprotein translocase subunit YajC [Phycisphaerae bacterium RAS2]|nr:preprotein translocase subunit YajC [Phycisphaerae bacterium RAS2]